MLRVTEILPIIGLLMMLSGSLCTAIAIAYETSKGRPKTFDREMYWTCFASAAMLAGIVAYFGFRSQPRGISPHLWTATSLMVAILLTGVSFGCGLGMLTYRRPEPEDEGKRA